MKKFKVFALVFAIMLSATGLGLLFGSNQPASTQAKVSAEETTILDPGIYKVGTDGKPVGKPTKSWGVIATKASDNSLSVNLSSSDGKYLVCGALPEGVTSLNKAFSDKDWLTDIVFTDSFNTSNVTDMSKMFHNCSLTSLDLSNFNTSKVTNMQGMFSDCYSLTSITFGDNFNTSKVTDMNGMFSNCSSLTSAGVNTADKKYDLNFGNNFDTSKVTNMGSMFSSCEALTSITFGDNFDTSNVTDMSSMFGSCYSLTSITFGAGFKTSKVTNMGSMFSLCEALTSITFGDNFDTSNVTNMSYMFDNCSSLTNLNLSNFDTINVTNMSYMFSFCSKLTSITFGDNFNTSNVTNMSFMFCGCNKLTSLDVSKFDTSNVTNMSFMFSDCSALTNLNLSKFDTSKVTSMTSMFSDCKSLQNIKMPNTMKADSTIKLSALSLPSKNASGTAIAWYSLASGAENGTPVVANNSVSSYASNILTIDDSKSFNKINTDVFGAPAEPETPSTGVVLDVVLPAFSIVLVLASLVAVAFVGKKKKQY